MIANNIPCYLYKNVRNKQLYKRTTPLLDAKDALTRWNTFDKSEAGLLTKIQWEDRATKWTYRDGYVLETFTGAKESLAC